MTIKEIENLSGMTRANIRFYEKEGFLTPERTENGYRNYSERELEVLKRIRLLRMLHMSLEEIKSLHTGECDLLEMLDRHLEKIKEERGVLEQSEEICRTMRQNQVSYETLNAQYYLDEMVQKNGLAQCAFVPDTDAIPKVKEPWKRYLAWMVDMSIYTLPVNLFLTLEMHVILSNYGIWGIIAEVCLNLLGMLIIEPICLSAFGTTPGKWLLGFYVTDNEDKKLSCAEARKRTLLKIRYGMGYGIPLYDFFRQWKSYQVCKEGGTLQWEEETYLFQKDRRMWRVCAGIVLYTGIFLLNVFCGFTTLVVPKNRGDITVAEFCENYNRFSDCHELNGNYRLDSKGRWVQSSHEDSSVSLDSMEYSRMPNLTFIEENGVMTGLSVSVESRNSEEWMSLYRDETYFYILSFVCAQKDCKWISAEKWEMFGEIQKNKDNFAFSKFGVDVSRKFSVQGYECIETLGVAVPEENSENRYFYQFEMKK